MSIVSLLADKTLADKKTKYQQTYETQMHRLLAILRPGAQHLQAATSKEN
jgi:hypothetical protein